MLKLIAFLSVGLWVGCGGPYNSKLDENRVVGVPNGNWKAGLNSQKNQPPLYGVWKSECVSDHGQNARSYEVRIFPDRTLLILFFATTDSCKELTQELIVQFSSLPLPAGERKWSIDASNEKITDVLVAPRSPRVASMMSEAEYCQRKDWSYNQAQSIKNQGCLEVGYGFGTLTLTQTEDPALIQMSLPTQKLKIWLRNRL